MDTGYHGRIEMRFTLSAIALSLLATSWACRTRAVLPVKPWAGHEPLLAVLFDVEEARYEDRVKAQRRVDAIALAAQAQVGVGDNLRRRLLVLNAEFFASNGLRCKDDDLSTSAALAQGHGACLGLCLAYVDCACAIGIDATIVELPQHTLVRCALAGDQMYVETTQDGALLDRAALRASGGEWLLQCMRPLSHKQVRAMLMLQEAVSLPKDAPRAKRLLAAAGQLDPDSSDLWYLRAAMAAGGEPSLEGALRCVDRAIALRPADLSALVMKAGLLRDSFRFDDSQAVIDQMMAVDCRWPQPWIEAARTLRDHGDGVNAKLLLLKAAQHAGIEVVDVPAEDADKVGWGPLRRRR